jgi:hypothetical protein
VKYPFRLGALAAVTGVAIMVFALGASGSAKRVVASTSCYPGNEFTAAVEGGGELGPGGAFSASSEGSGTTTNTEEGNLAGSAVWNMKLNVTGNSGGAFTYSSGSMSGSIRAEIRIAGNVFHTRFVSNCIAEAVVENDGDGDYLIEAEFEGTASNPPWNANGSGPAVLSVTFQTEGAADHHAVQSWVFGLEQGITCSETSNEFNMVGGGASGKVDIPTALNTSSGETRSRASLPGSGTSCSGVYFGD